MSSPHATVDLDDVEGLLDADRDGLLRAAAMAGAQVRATAAAVEEGELESVQRPAAPHGDLGRRPRSGRKRQAPCSPASLGGWWRRRSWSPPRPAWIGALDVLVVAGDDPGDPALVGAAATAVRRGARVVVVAPYEGPLRDATAGRTVVLAPRVWVPDEFGLCRYLAAGLATLQAVDPALTGDLTGLADELDAEALRNSVGREVFTNPGQSAGRADGRASGGAAPATAWRPWRWRDTARRRCCGWRTGRWPRSAWPTPSSRYAAEWRRVREADRSSRYSTTSRSTVRCPAARVRTFVLTTDAERPVVSARVAGLDDVDVINAEDVPSHDIRRRAPRSVAGAGRARRTTTGDAGRAIGDGGGVPETGSGLAAVDLLRGAVRTYAWGSRTAIAEFTGRPSPDSASRGGAVVRRPSR